jgi:hypothetical protein
MTFSVLTGGLPEAVDAYHPTAFDLTVHPLRPGLAHAAVTLTLDAKLAEAVEGGAAVDGLPTPLWAGLAIESERAVRALAQGTGIDTTALERTLAAAAVHTAHTLVAQRGRRLARYALALRTCGARETERPRQRLTVAVPQHTLTAWELAAAVERQSVVDWAVARLASLPAGRARWESAAAQAGQTLGEWIAVQAARRSSD